MHRRVCSVIVVLLAVAACGRGGGGAGGATLRTDVGAFTITSTDAVDEYPEGCGRYDCLMPAEPGKTVVVVSLALQGGGDRSDVGGRLLAASKDAYLTDDKGNRASRAAAGLFDDQLQVAFGGAVAATRYTLQWPGNDPITLKVGGGSSVSGSASGGQGADAPTAAVPQPGALSAAALRALAAPAPDAPAGSCIVFRPQGTPGLAVNADGGAFRTVTDESSLAPPTWSPDGRRIVFTNYRTLAMVNADGSGLAELAADPNLQYLSAAFSPDGKRLAYGAGPGGRTDLYVADVVTGQVRNVTNTPDMGEAFPAWSPDGQRLAVVDADGSLIILDADGGGRTKVDTDGKLAHSPAWSPDGSRIGFLNGQVGVVVVGADGADPVVVPGSTTGSTGLSWSPDGSQIVYESKSEIIRSNLDGSGRQKIGSGFYPSWSPACR